MIRKITSLGIILIVLIAIAWDIYAYNTEDNSSISVVITDWAKQHPAIVLIAGILMGHWFIPARGSEDP